MSAFEDHNYCSNSNDQIDQFKSNVFYFSNNHLESGKHISRFTLRAISGGFQHYNIDGCEKTLTDDNFLLVEQGMAFEHYLNQSTAVEGVIVAFSPQFLSNYFHQCGKSTAELLDHPEPYYSQHFHFYSNTFAKSSKLKELLEGIAMDIRSKDHPRLYYEEMFSCIFDEVIRIDNHLNSRINTLSALKGRTRQELYKRLSLAKDFIDSNIDKDLSLEVIAQAAYLSPFHFLRSFKNFYQITPYQYILQTRLKRAKFYFDQKTFNQSEVMSMCGFEHIKSFQRVYKKYFGISPSQYVMKVAS